MIAAPILSPLEFLIMVLLSGGFGMPAGVPPAEEDPMAAQAAPAECILYASWSGMGTPDATSGNHTEKLLAEQDVQDFFNRNRGRMLEMIWNMTGNRADAKEVRDDVDKLIELVYGKAGALYISELSFQKNGPPIIKAAGLLRVGDDAAKMQKLLKRMQARAAKGEIAEVKIGSRTFARVKFDDDLPAITWGIEGEHLFIGLGEGSLEALLSRVGGKPPEWLTDIRAKMSVPRVASILYVDVNSLLQMALTQPGSDEAARAFECLGLDKVKSFASVAGMDDKGCVSRSLLTIEEKRTGLFEWLDAKPLVAADLEPIGCDALAALTFQLDAAWALDLWIQFLETVNPREAVQMQQALEQIQGQFGINVRDDLLKSLGDTWRLFVNRGPNAIIHGWAIAVGSAIQRSWDECRMS